MPDCSTVMNQLLQLIPRHQFERIVREHQADRNVKKFSCFNQLLVMLFAQLRGLDSLREIETTLMDRDVRIPAALLHQIPEPPPPYVP